MGRRMRREFYRPVLKLSDAGQDSVEKTCERCSGTKDVRMYRVTRPHSRKGEAEATENLCCCCLPNMITDGLKFKRV